MDERVALGHAARTRKSPGTRAQPERVVGASAITRIAAGGYHSLAVWSARAP
ncbi:MAG TPA: hypothetical protein VFX49_01520 [Chloroflexota bacterium]|nr:hypothetical protein [Chloroflexota bacterium]